MPVVKGDLHSLRDTYDVRTYSTLALIKSATKVITIPRAWCEETSTLYTYVTSGGSLIANDTTILITGDGGNTRWQGIAGTYIYNYNLTFSSGLTRTINDVTNDLITGKAGGQSIYGGTAASETLTISSTIHATKGNIIFGTSAYDEVNNRLGIGTTAPTYLLSLLGTVAATIGMERHTTTNTVGNSLTLRAGGATLAATNKFGGTLNYYDGLSTGNSTGTSHQWFTSDATTSGTATQAQTAKMTILSNGNVLIGTTTGISEVKLLVRGGASASSTWAGRVVCGGSAMSMVFGELDSKVVLASLDVTLGSWSTMYINPSSNANTYIGNTTSWATPANTILSVIGSTGRVGLGVITPSYLLSFLGTAAQTVGMERHTTADTAGNNLTLTAGGATLAGTNRRGGALVFYDGISTGNSTGKSFSWYTYNATGSGTSDQTATEKAYMNNDGTLYLTVGLIAQNCAVRVSASDVASGEYARFTTTGLESRTAAEVVADLSAAIAPASNTANYVPQWDGANSKTLKDGLAVGTAANNLVQLDGSAKLPAVDGSQLTGIAGGTINRITTIYEYTDFICLTAGATSGGSVWSGAAIASGTITGASASRVNVGIITVTSSTSANSGYRYVMGVSNIQGFIGNEVANFIIGTPASINAGTTIYIGFHDSSSETLPTDGAFMSIINTTLTGSCSNGGAKTDTGTTYTVTTSTYYHCKILVNNNATLVSFFVYDMAGTQLWTSTVATNIPTSNAFGHGFVATNSGIVAVALCAIDFMDFQLTVVR